MEQHRTTPWAAAAEHRIVLALEDLADPELAGPMAAYMRDRAPFHGIKSPAVQAAWKHVKADVDRVHGTPTPDDLLSFAEAMWREAEREHQYVGAKALAAAAGRRDVGGLEPEHLERIRDLIVTKSWWDSVDILAPNVVGALARAYPTNVVPVLDRWLADENMWLVRTAVIHQLKSKDVTDRDRLARYCVSAAPHKDFFVRKAIGWALRQYSSIDARWVEAFVEDHAGELSGLSKREAMKAINRERSRRAE